MKNKKVVFEKYVSRKTYCLGPKKKGSGMGREATMAKARTTRRS
jgi:hypothetical protein